MFIPQALRTYRMRADAEALLGVAIGSSALALVGYSLWLAWALWVDAWIAGIPSLFNIPLSLYLLVLLTRARMSVRSQREPVHATGG